VVIHLNGFHIFYALVSAAEHTEKSFVLIIFNQLHLCRPLFFKTTIAVVGAVGYFVG
jgi:hypothetical protein